LRTTGGLDFFHAKKELDSDEIPNGLFDLSHGACLMGGSAEIKGSTPCKGSCVNLTWSSVVSRKGFHGAHQR
jgi:hypothetical protein